MGEQSIRDERNGYCLMNRETHLGQYYSECLIPLLKGIKLTGDSNLVWTARRVVRRWTEFPRVLGKPNLYSRGALSVAQQRGIPIETLKWSSYKDQCLKSGLKDPNHSKGSFHHEHIVPVSQLVKGLLELEEPTAIEVRQYIERNGQIAWILKEEQKRLDSVCKSGNRIPELWRALEIELIGETNQDSSQG